MQLLLSWEWRWEIVLLLLTAALIYSNGWWQLRRLKRLRLAAGKRLGAYLGGLLALAIGTMSFIDSMGGQLLLAHMVQHLFLTMVGPVLIWWADPFPLFLWGLPAHLRRTIGSWFRCDAPVRQVICWLTKPGVSWLTFIAVFVGWHEPSFYNAALRLSSVHDLQHVTFTGSAMLFWWHLFPAGPRIHPRMFVFLRMGYVLAVIPPTMLLGISIAFAQQPLYTYYTTVPRIWGLTVMEDQTMAGAVMWIPTNMMYILAAVITMAVELSAEEARQQTAVRQKRKADG